LFEIPTPFAGQQEHRKILAVAHDVVAWTIFTLAIAHALAALFHQFVLKDHLLQRVGFQLRRE
jgi:cytochrome b561